MTGRHWSSAGLIALGVLVGSAWSQAPERHWLDRTGADWLRLEPHAKEAYIEGFLSGAALSQAVGGARDTAAVRTALDALRRQGTLRFPYGANVYASRITDFYWWKNHLPLPMWYAFLEVNTTLGRPIPDSLP
jgi:hypothetical protein